MFYVYVLQNNLGRHYVGFSENLKSRMQSHKQGTVKATKDGGYNLVFYSAFISNKKALDFERYLKHGSGHAFCKKHFIENE